jgi:large subunit ribosomal protein L4e
MMLPVYNLDGKEVEKIQIPLVFSTPYNPRLIKRAVLAIQSHNRLPKGTDPLAGERSSSESWNTGRGISRIGRIKSHSGPRAGSAAGVAGVTGGRTPHPPVSSKNIYHKLNKKEKTSALMSAISASMNRDFVINRGHKIDNLVNLPLVVVDDLESMNRTKDIRITLTNLGLSDELERLSQVRLRSGKSRLRGRSRKIKKGPLIVCSQDLGIGDSCKNLLGVDLVEAKNLNVSDLAPGTDAGRLVIWTKNSFSNLSSNILKAVEINAS